MLFYTTKYVVICYSSKRKLIQSGRCVLGMMGEEERVNEKEN